MNNVYQESPGFSRGECQEYQRQLYHWRAPNVSRLDEDQLYALLSKLLKREERMVKEI